MKIATWNVNSLRKRLPQVSQWLIENPVDVICFQETKVVDEDFPREPLERLGYHLYFAGQKSYNGVAIASLTPLESVTVGFTPILGEENIEDLDEQKRLIAGRIGNFQIINVYVPNGSQVNSDKYVYKLRWLKALEEYLKNILGTNSREICICGDFNIALEDLDIHNPKGKDKEVMATPAERAALHNLLAIGLKDAFRKFIQEGGHYSWWDYRQGGFSRNRGWRIDHIYLTDELYQRSSSCSIDIEPRKVEQPSDHTPVILEI
jgi:exodeoxyribonuclease-3